MESDDASTQLTYVQQLRTTTVREAHRVPRWTGAAMGIGIVAFFVLQANGSTTRLVVLDVAWSAFVLGWVAWTNARRRAIAPRRRFTKRDAVEQLAFVAILEVVLVIGGMVLHAWLAVGVVMALAGSVGGAVLSRRARRG